ncbi:MAG: hypothetical protein HRU09_16880 [Oligoflexales bacterium]|nr:hypothetical protein [Oligoflexales bacterium]
MDSEKRDFLYDLADFCYSSMNCCAIESEKATGQVNDIITILLDDATRVSAISKETLEAISSMREIINNLAAEGDRDAANDLAKALSQTAAEDEEMRLFVSPIMEALQFQDRIAQNMNNFSKMLRTWIEKREELEGSSEFSEVDKIDFGERLLACTTMMEEREIIRTYIDNLKEEETAQSDVMFF